MVIHASLIISNLGASAWKISTLQIVSLALRLLCNLSETRPSLHDMECHTIPPPPPHPHLLSLQTKERHQKPVPRSWWPLQPPPKLKFSLTQLLTLLRHKPSLCSHYRLSAVYKISCFSLWGQRLQPRSLGLKNPPRSCSLI